MENNTRLDMIINEHGAYFTKSAFPALTDIINAGKNYADYCLWKMIDPDNDGTEKLEYVKEAAIQLLEQLDKVE